MSRYKSPDHLAVIRPIAIGDNPAITHLCDSAETAEQWLVQWLNDNPNRPPAIYFITKVVWCITE